MLNDGQVNLDSLHEMLDYASWHDNYISARCPFHDDNQPSMLVYPDGFICLACNERGTLTKLADKVRGIVSIPYHYKNPWSGWLRNNDLEHVINTAHSVLRKYPSQGYYLRSRGINNKLIWRLKLGIITIIR